ncbi:MAG TPA: dodecin [Herbaspirillum sp.]|jgi:flavin-binding protein dodecin
MNNHTYKVIEIVGTSETGSDDAIRNAIVEAGKSLRHIDWYEMVRQSGHVVDGKIGQYQATLKIGFRLDK